MFPKVTRAEAIKLGLTRYFSGVECVNGHIDFRRTGNRECIQCRRDRNAEWYRENPEWDSKKKKSRYMKKRKEIIAKAIQYQKDHPEVPRNTQAKRRKQVRGTASRVSANDIRAIMTLQRRTCIYCKSKLVGRKYHIDHIQPLSKGGLHDVNNLQILCQTCNLRKSDKDPFAYANEVGLLF